MGSFIFQAVLFNFIRLASSLQLMNAVNLFSQGIRQKYAGLSDFSIDFMSFSGNQKILTFGGTLPSSNFPNSVTATTVTLQSRPLAQQSTQYTLSYSLKPAKRSGHCSVIYQYKLYIYGGANQTGQYLTDLWEFNTLFLSWTRVDDSADKFPFKFKQCNLVRNETNLVIIGIDTTNQIRMASFSILNNLWHNLSYQYADYISISGKLWSNQLSQTLLSVQSVQNPTSQHYKYSSHLSSPVVFVKRNPKMLWSYLLITDTKIFHISLQSMKVMLVQSMPSEKPSQIYDCEISDKWLFIFTMQTEEQTTQTQRIVMNYFSLQNFNAFGANFYDVPVDELQPNSTKPWRYKTVIVNDSHGDIYIVSEITLKSWILYEHCDKLMNMSNLLICLYDQIHCKEGFRGQLCNQPTCPNTLYLYDQQKNQEIFYECSNNGKCTATGCVCDQYWTGEDCSQYTRTECKGTLMENWPIMNCQCQSQTMGGNSCQIVFCYNDCGQHGTCLSNGQCKCQDGYYGQDCTIIIIQFPGLTVTI